MATFSNLADTVADTIVLRFTSGGLAPAVSSAITVASNNPAPTITGASLYYPTAKPKKGKRTATGFQLNFSIPMSQGSLLGSGNYTMVAKVKKGKKTTTTNVLFTVMSQSNTSVVLSFSAKQKFTSGGMITVNSPASGGILSAADGELNSAIRSRFCPGHRASSLFHRKRVKCWSRTGRNGLPAACAFVGRRAVPLTRPSAYLSPRGQVVKTKRRRGTDFAARNGRDSASRLNSTMNRRVCPA